MESIFVKLSGIVLTIAGVWSIWYGLRWFRKKVSKKEADKVVGLWAITGIYNYKNLSKNYKRTGIFNIIGGVLMLVFGVFVIIFL